MLNLPKLTFEAGTKCQILYYSNHNYQNQPIKFIETEWQEIKDTKLISLQEVKKSPELILVCSYYNFLSQQTDHDNYLFLPFRQLMEENVLEVNKGGNLPSGNEIGSKNYFEDGTIPFIRTSDIADLEIKTNPKHLTSQEVYEQYRNRQNVKLYDILLVKDGNAGECAVIMQEEEKIVICSGFYKLRVNPNNYGIDTWNLIFALYNCKVKDQINNLLFRSTIPHLSNRIKEIVLAFPKSFEILKQNSELMKNFLLTRYEVKKNFLLIREDKCSLIKSEEGFCSLHTEKPWQN